jgi:two-component system, NarL family, response regulator LiaR
MNPNPIRVVVVDDHDLLREGVVSCLSGHGDIAVVGEASTGEAALELMKQVHPDVVIMDLVMSGMGGIEAIRQLRALHPTLGVIALSSFTEQSLIQDAIEAGATGYLVKSVDTATLISAVRGAAAGHGSFSPEVMKVLNRSGVRQKRVPLDALSPRERDIAALMIEGRTNTEIARRLELSIYTVKNHISSILMKLGAQSRTEATSMLLTPTDR